MQVFLLLLVLLLLASMILPYIVVHDVAGIHAVLGVSSVNSLTVTASMLLFLLLFLLVFLLLLALLLLALLHYECCSIMSLLLFFFPRPAGKVFRTLQVPGRRPFSVPNAGKVFLSLEFDHLHSPMPETSGP